MKTLDTKLEKRLILAACVKGLHSRPEKLGGGGLIRTWAFCEAGEAGMENDVCVGCYD